MVLGRNSNDSCLVRPVCYPFEVFPVALLLISVPRLWYKVRFFGQLSAVAKTKLSLRGFMYNRKGMVFLPCKLYIVCT